MKTETGVAPSVGRRHGNTAKCKNGEDPYLFLSVPHVRTNYTFLFPFIGLGLVYKNNGPE